jgi:hypothetical protein
MRGVARIATIAFVVTVGLFLWLAPQGEPPSVVPRNVAPSSLTAAKPPPIPKIDKSDQAQKKRADLIKKLIGMRVFMKVEMPGNLPRVWTGPAFQALDFDTKSSFVSVVYAYHFDGSDISDGVRVFDGKTGKEIGDFSVNGGLRLF